MQEPERRLGANALDAVKSFGQAEHGVREPKALGPHGVTVSGLNGELLGRRQSGLSVLRFTKLRADRPLLERARAAAQELIDVEGPLDDAVLALFPDEGLAA